MERQERNRKPPTTSARQTSKRRVSIVSRRLWLVIIGSLITLAIGRFALMQLRSGNIPPDWVARSTPRAAIVDQASLTNPNQEFIALASAMLETAGYRVDVYSGAEITAGISLLLGK